MSYSITEGAVHTLPSPLPLVGRASELAELEAMLEGDGDGASLVFVRGEGGVGKSRLAAELAERASRRSWRVATGRAYPVETGVPYALFSDAWLPILREMEPSKLTVLTRGGQSELRYLFPALDGEHADIDVGSEDPDEFRTRLMWNFTEFVKRYAKQEPILCLLEDLQWADESSIQMIHFMARQVAGHRVVFVCTYNDQERDRAPHLVRTERSLASMAVARVLHLQPLTLDQVTELVGRSFGVDGDSVREFSAVLFGWTRGNPFFAEEIVKSMVESGRIRRESGTWVGWDAKEFGMPGSVRDAVVQRVLTFSESAQMVAELAAVVGNRASYPLLQAISGLESAQLLQALEELCAQRVLDERAEQGEVVFHFSHPLVRQILYGEFGLARAQGLHGVVAEAMEAHYGDKAVDHADELAFHFARTDSGQLRAKAARYLAAAGRRALDRRADQEAINYLEAAMERAAADGGNGAAPSTSDLVPLLARARMHVGDYEQASRLWTSALEVVPAESREHSAVRRVLGMAHFWRGDRDAALRHLREGLRAAEEFGDQAGTVRLLVAEAHCLHEIGRGAEALEALSRALPLADSIGDAHLLARVHRALGLLHLWVGPPEACQAHSQRAMELAREVDDLTIEFWARWGLAVHTGMRGDTEGIARAIEEVNELADRIRSPVLKLWTADMAIELLYARGEWDRGILEGEKVIALARSLNQRTLLPRLLVWTSLFHVGRGDFDRAEQLLAEAEEASGWDPDEPDPKVQDFDVHQIVPVHIGRAHYLVGIGDFHDAIEIAERGLEIAEGTGYILWAIHRLLPILAEACLWADDIDRAEAVGKRMREHAERIDHRLGIAWADAVDALLCWKRGDPAGSIPLLRAAADELDSIPQMWNAARLRRQLSARHWELGEADEAKQELDRVWDVLVEVGAGEEKEKARQDYKKMGLRAPPGSVSDGPLGLTPEELEVAILAAQGMSNPEAAKARNSSVRTISTHLTNIYKKLGIGGAGARIRLGKMVREAGLTE